MMMAKWAYLAPCPGPGMRSNSNNGRWTFWMLNTSLALNSGALGHSHQ